MHVQQLDPPQQEQLNAALSSVAQQLRRLADVPWLCSIIDPSDHEVNHQILLLSVLLVPVLLVVFLVTLSVCSPVNQVLLIPRVFTCIMLSHFETLQNNL